MWSATRWGLALVAASAWNASGQPQQPIRGTADTTVYVRLNEIEGDRAAAPARITGLREIHSPLARKENVHDVPAAITPALQRLLIGPSAAQTVRGIAPTSATVLTGFRAVPDDSTAIPPDTYGAVGPEHVLTTLNTEIQVQRRDGSVVSRVTIEEFFERLGPFVSGVFDPRAAYDSVNSRWFVAALADSFSASSSSVLVAVSQSPDPAGAWTQFRIRPESPDDVWFDYPSMAISGEWVIVTTNLFRMENYVRTHIYVFTKTDLQSGVGNFRRFTDTRGTLVPAASTAPLARAPLVSPSGGSGRLLIGEISGNLGAEVFTTTAATPMVDQPWSFQAPGNAFGFAPQLGSQARIDTGDARMQNCLLRFDSLWCTHHIFLPAGSVNRTAVQFYELNFPAYTLVQRGRVEDPTGAIMYAYPSIAVNGARSVLLGYSRFSADRYAESAYSFRLASDPPGELQEPLLIKRGEASYQRGSERNRWGDFSATQVDLIDDTSFWTIQEYAGSTASGSGNRWGTWWAKIEPLPTGTPLCSFTLSNTSLTIPPEANIFSIAVTARPGCKWMAASDIGWLSIGGGEIGDGTGVVMITAIANPLTASRNGALTIAGIPVSIQQSAATSPAPTQLLTRSFTTDPSAQAGETLNVRVAVENVSPTSSGRFRVGFYFSQSQPVTTASTASTSSCTFPEGLQPGNSVVCSGAVRVPLPLAPGTYFVAAIADDQNATNMTDRSLATRVADTGPVAISPSPQAPVISSAGIAHGATTQGGPIAPGLNVVLYGSALGPSTLQNLQLEDGLVSTTLAGTRIFFNGVAAPIHYTSAGQVSVYVPYEVAGSETAAVQAVFNGRVSAAVTIPVVATRPGIYTLDFSGRGQAAINNQGGGVNGPSNAAPRGSIVEIYAAGGGQLIPPGVTGQVIGAPLPVLAAQPVEVTIGGQRAIVRYAGPAPISISGFIQINAEIPASAPVGDAVPVTLRIGDATSPDGVTMAIR